ncbi:hypothetical protein TOPH_03535 [Tolypocladium ophioglossoides CBS 100239]|uniref:Uncharacterized protein n=1 Tax=Tolypocladium ophioglossoides (strain CBS 100239) TaxID=1163406 RepID=A0A0L0NCX4_TOLOC|nr:hypothetical protein TOPH_03535 [Tolypocladium ophioglossoides CBS 100239]
MIFFLARQHPSASAALLVSLQSTPCRRGCGFIPIEHMVTFIHIAYIMMALLHETVPAFGGTWIECLRNLGRCRMAIEGGEVGGRDIWTECRKIDTASKASYKTPTPGQPLYPWF